MKVFAALLALTLTVASTTADEASRFLQVGALPPTVTVNAPATALPGSEICFDIEVAGAGGSTSTSAPIDVVFAIDSSGSMSGARRANAVQASKFFLSQLNEATDYAGVVSWDSNVDFALGMSNDFNEVNGWLDQVDASGGTNLNVGVDASVTLLDDAMMLLASNGRISDKIIVFINDGTGSYTPCASNTALQQAVNEGYTIYSVLIGSSGSVAALTDMATCTGGFFTPAPQPSDVQPILDAILSTVVSSTIPFQVVLDAIIDTSNFGVTSISPASSTGLPGLMWTVDDTTGGFEQGESSAFTICGTVPTTPGVITVLSGGSVEYEDSDGTSEPSVTIPPVSVEVKIQGAGGDPHFLLFKHDKRQSFHGECDLVLFQKTNFEADKDVNIHIRTTIQDFFSYIAAVAVQVGQDVLEFNGPNVLLNHVPAHVSEDSQLVFGDNGDYFVSVSRKKRSLYYTIDLAGKMAIHIRNGKFMSVSLTGLEEAMTGSMGVMGNYETGLQLARDGISNIKYFNKFAMHWQVNPSVDPTLFGVAREPQLPQETCRLPSIAQVERRGRRLRGAKDNNSELYKDAVAMCEENHSGNVDSCVEDVLLTGSLDVALAW